MRSPAVALRAAPRFLERQIAALSQGATIPRNGVVVALAVALALGVTGAGVPPATVATPESPVLPLTRAAFRTTVATDHSLTAPVAITFTSPMDPASVGAMLRVQPQTPVDLRWDAAGTVVTVAPRTTWEPGTFYTISVLPDALATTGQPLARAARAVFMTRPATTGEVSATDRIGDEVSADTAFQVTFVGPVDADTVPDAIHLDPATPGSVRVDPGAAGTSRYTFVPSAPLRPGIRYNLSVAGVRDLDGLLLEPLWLSVRTIGAPAVVAFRPVPETHDVPTDAAISIRFTESMDPRSTAQALKVSIDGKPIAGTIAWANSNSLLRFTPAVALPHGTAVTVDVGPAAESSSKVRLDKPARAVFRTAAEPTPVPPPVTTPTDTTAKASQTTAPPGKPGKTSKGKGPDPAVGGGSWADIETYYLDLMNCTRTGGWVTSTGKCSSPGGRDVPPLKLDQTISSKVSRPYARLLATGNLCNHFIGGNPGTRLKPAGFTSYRWAENLGCRSGDPRAAVLGSHLFFQNERPYLGGHYVNLMNPKYDRVGIGVWVSKGRVRLVIDFYHP